MGSFLSGQVCLVTGGAGGIGWALSQALADHGAHVYACDNSADNLALARTALPALPWGDRIVLAHCDVSDRPAVESWIAGVQATAGRIDVLVNNAAYIRWSSVADTSIEEAEQTMRVGYNAMLYTIKAVLPLMQAAHRGHIVNVGSSLGRLFVPGPSAAYVAVKAAIDGYTQILQTELRGGPIAVTLVRPYAVAGTDFFGKHVPSSNMPRTSDFIPYLTPPEVAAAILDALRHRRPVVDVPRSLRLAYLLFAIAPGFVRWTIRRSGPGRRDYGAVRWHYRSKER